MSEILNHVGKDKNVTFAYYVDNALWYRAENGFLFPVPIEDAGNTLFNAIEKSLYLMRWIRKHLQFIENAKNEQT